MSEMTDARAVEVLAAMREDGGVVADADYTAAIDRAVARLGGGEAQADEVVCLECGQPTMHMGQVCYACSHPAAGPAEAQAQGGGEAWQLDPEPIVSDCGIYTYMIDAPAHGAAIECHGGTQALALSRAQAVMRATAPPSAPVGVSLSDWSLRMAAKEAGQYVGAGAHGFEDRPEPSAPVGATITNPWTGKPRDYRDVDSDPEGVLCVEPGAPLKAATSVEGLTTKEAWWAGYRAGKGLPADTPRQETLAQQPAAVDADSVVGELCDSHAKFAEWWGELGERRSLLFMRALSAALAAQPPAEAQAQGGGERKPDGFHYRYRDPYGGGGTIIRTNNGQEVNGSWPIEAVPYWYSVPPSVPVGVEAMPGIRRELAGIVRRDDGEPVWIEPNEADAILRALAQQPAAVDGDFIKRVADSLIAKGWDIDPDCDGTGVVQLREAVISALAAQPGGGAS